MFEKEKRKTKGIRPNIGTFLLLILFAFIAIYYFMGDKEPDTDLSAILQLVDDGKVQHVDIVNNKISVKLIDTRKAKQPETTVAGTSDASSNNDSLLNILANNKQTDKNKIVLDGRTINKYVSPNWMNLLLEKLEKAKDKYGLTYNYTEPISLGAMTNVILILVMLGLLAFSMWNLFFRQMGEGKNPLNFGGSKAKRVDLSTDPVTFADVAGADEEKGEMQEIVDFLKNPQKYYALGAKIPRGVLLVGPPGTGKTLLAKAVATEAGVPFYTISGSDFMEMYVGVGASRVREMFNEVKKHTPAIIFIDEIDAIGRQRGSGLGGGHDEREQTLNQILVEMDGFSSTQGIIVMAATNRPDILDAALTRPGRFDRQITVSPPDIQGREDILAVHAKGKKLAKGIDLREIARITPGFTGADLANLLNEAALLAARKNAKEITYFDIQDAIFKVMLGPEKKNRIMSEKERSITAHHEAGHAIMVRAMSETERVERVSIISAGQAGGYTAHKPFEDLYYASKDHLLQNIMIALGGRGGEQLIFKQITTGASNDLESCNKLARKMVTVYGMAEHMENLVFTESDDMFMGHGIGHSHSFSEHTAQLIDNNVKEIIDAAYKRVMTCLSQHETALRKIAERLLEVERIDEVEFEILYLENTPPEILALDAVNLGREQMIKDGLLPTKDNLAEFKEKYAAQKAETEKKRAMAQLQAAEVPDLTEA